jgi:hypothetical protein
MIDGLKPYPEYKDSGVAWLGAMPGHWDVRRLKQYIRAMQKLILWLPRSSVGASPDAPASRDGTGRWSGRDCIPTRSVGTRKTAQSAHRAGPEMARNRLKRVNTIRRRTLGHLAPPAGDPEADA